MWSRLLGWGGVVLLIIGPIVALGLESTGLAGLLAVLGLGSAVVGAVLGQIGRAKQGRVI